MLNKVILKISTLLLKIYGGTCDVNECYNLAYMFLQRNTKGKIYENNIELLHPNTKSYFWRVGFR
jgi:hypothetical protein